MFEDFNTQLLYFSAFNSINSRLGYDSYNTGTSYVFVCGHLKTNDLVRCYQTNGYFEISDFNDEEYSLYISTGFQYGSIYASGGNIYRIMSGTGSRSTINGFLKSEPIIISPKLENNESKLKLTINNLNQYNFKYLNDSKEIYDFSKFTEHEECPTGGGGMTDTQLSELVTPLAFISAMCLAMFVIFFLKSIIQNFRKENK